MTFSKYIIYILVLLSPLSIARGDFIIVQSASTDMGNFVTSQSVQLTLTNTFNGSGLATSPSFTADHDAVDPNNSWRASSNTTTGSVTFDFGTIFDVVGFSFWNANDGDVEQDGSSGINGVTITASTTSTGENFFSIAGAPTSFLQRTSSPSSPEQFTFISPVSAQRIRFTILSNHGGAETGFAEVAFNDNTIAAVPEPSSVLLVAGSMTLAASYRRWRKRKSPNLG
jgi:hypothetical protein